MDRNRPRFRAELLLVVLLLLASGVLWWWKTIGSRLLASAPAPPPERQSLPPASALELPPTAPLPAYPHPVFSSIHPEPTPSLPSVLESKSAETKKPKKGGPPIPTQIEIINEYNQVVELDFKYLEIAVQSDRYGYANQAIRYYKKYLDIAPMGPYANSVRSRLVQLEGSR